MLSEKQVEVLLELASFLGLNASVEQNFEKFNLFRAFSYFFHLDESLIGSIHKPRKCIEMF
jgi:hypothetical protein